MWLLGVFASKFGWTGEVQARTTPRALMANPENPQRQYVCHCLRIVLVIAENPANLASTLASTAVAKKTLPSRLRRL